jgi:hypothetical protein
MYGPIKHSAKEKRKLKQHKRWIGVVLNKRAPLKLKKEVLVQRGGFLGAILAPLLKSLAGGLFGSLLGNGKR